MTDPPPPRDRERTRRPLVRMWIYATVAAILGTALVLLIDWTPTPASTAADDIDRLYDVLLIFSVPIFVLVMAVAIYCVVYFRARPGETADGPPIHGNTRLEVFWVTIPALIVSGLAVYGGIVLHDIEKSKPGEMTVNVTGQQFAWTFGYEKDGKKVQSYELMLPKDKPVVFKIRSKDVLHSFWVPEFRLKLDAVPGQTGTVRLTPNKTGSWQVVCTELCGLGHSTMRQPARVVDRADLHGLARQADHRRDGRGGHPRRRRGRRGRQGHLHRAGLRRLPHLYGCRRHRHRWSQPRRARRRCGQARAGQVRGGLRPRGDRGPRGVRGQGIPRRYHASRLQGQALAGGDRRACEVSPQRRKGRR